MGFAIDTFAILRAIGDKKVLFRDLDRDLAKTAPALIEKQLKAIGGDLERLVQVRMALGAEQFDAIAETLGGTKALALVKKLDKHHPQIKDTDKTWAVDRLKALAAGAVPMAAPIRANAPASRKAAKTPSEIAATLSSKAMGAKRR